MLWTEGKNRFDFQHVFYSSYENQMILGTEFG